MERLLLWDAEDYGEAVRTPTLLGDVGWPACLPNAQMRAAR
jgi:hypothetical protein